ncbi:MAG: Ig-like domain-containing protein [candidate division Zixibacteria bacterium]|nr:Ig-like domain-containing protein [candidate division Zixibacteria bacterium]
MNNNILHRGKLSFLSIIILTLFYFNCAEIVSPPGGEEDKKPPVLLGSVPANGAIDVPPSDRIELYFSEPVVEPTRDNPVYLSPRLKESPKIKWKSDRVIIELPDSFKTDQTYIISVSPTVTDLRNNKLDSAVIIAFSTGATIDSGAIAGFVFGDGKPQSGALLALYELAGQPDSIPFDSIYPDYLTISSRTGYFSFQYLPEKEYRLLAFNDKNKDERFNPLRETFALPDRPINIGGEISLKNILMAMTVFDTTRVEIISAVLNPDNLLKIRITRKIPLDLLRISPSNIELVPVADTLSKLYGVSFQETGLDESSLLNVLFEGLVTGTYNLRLTYDIDKPKLVFENIELALKEDVVPPGVLSFQPGDKPIFLSGAEVEISFSEPLDTGSITDQTFLLWESDSIAVAVNKYWRDPFHLSFDAGTLKPGGRYRLDITEFDILDRAGNAMGDSLLSYSFSFLNADSLGSISGEVLRTLPGLTGSPALLTFDNLNTKQNFKLTVPAKDFKIDVPAGRYLLSGFIDRDLNEEWSAGKIHPFQPSETMATYPDTIRVRARFETSEIKFEFK